MLGLSERRIVKCYSFQIVESPNGGMVKLWSDRIVESLNSGVNRVVEWLNAGMVEFFMVTSSSSGLFEFSER